MGQPVLVREIPFVKGEDDDLMSFEQKVHQVEWGAVVEGVGIVIREILQTRAKGSGAA